MTRSAKNFMTESVKSAPGVMKVKKKLKKTVAKIMTEQIYSWRRIVIHDAGRDFMTEKPNSQIFQQKYKTRHENVISVMKSAIPVMTLWKIFMTGIADFMTPEKSTFRMCVLPCKEPCEEPS